MLAVPGAIAIGLSLGLLGSGGSILTVPVLVYLVGQDEKVAIAGSLFIVGSIAVAAVIEVDAGRRVQRGARCEAAAAVVPAGAGHVLEAVRHVVEVDQRPGGLSAHAAEIDAHVAQPVEVLLLLDLFGIDERVREHSSDAAGDFTVVYHLFSIDTRSEFRVKTSVTEADLRVPSAVPIFPNANWYEREVYDLFGIDFAGHPDLRRILMPDDWPGHPQRKDYPLGGIPVEYKGATTPPPDERRSYS